jgi:hypothetical protein
VRLARTIELQSATPSYPKAPLGVTPGAWSDPKHRQLARQVGGVSLIQASSMAITFQYKIALRPGSVFCFGTISSVANEEGILHRIADPPEKKPSPKISAYSATSSAPGEDYLLQVRNRELIYPKNLVVHLVHRRVDTDYEEKRSKRDRGPSSCSSDTFALKEGHREVRHRSDSFLPRRPLHRGESRIISHLRRRANHAWRRTSSARSSPMEEPTLEYSATSRSWGTGPGAACIPR